MSWCHPDGFKQLLENKGPRRLPSIFVGGFILMTSYNVLPKHLSNFRHRTLWDFFKFYGKFPTHMFVASFRFLGK